MTHLYIASGTATGGVAPRTLELDVFENISVSNSVTLSYVVMRSLTLDRYTNAQTFNNVTLQSIVVHTLTADLFTNANTFPGVTLVNLPFVPVNTETTDLLNETTGDYNTTRKIQIDNLITNLKTAGVWSKLDWFYGGQFMANEHDSLIDWTHPTRSLVKVGSPTFTPFVGWQGMASINNSKLKSGWQPTDGPHSTLTSFTLFVRVDSANPENNAQLAGNWNRSAGPGPTAPVGTFITLNVVAGTWDAGANVNAFDGIPGAALGAIPATYAVVRSGSTETAYRNGASVGTDSAATTANRTDAEGLCILGTPLGASAGHAFNGMVPYAGWGAALTGGELAAIDAAVVAAISPPSLVTGALLVNSADDYLASADGTYVLTDGP